MREIINSMHVDKFADSTEYEKSKIGLTPYSKDVLELIQASLFTDDSSVEGIVLRLQKHMRPTAKTVQVKASIHDLVRRNLIYLDKREKKYRSITWRAIL